MDAREAHLLNQAGQGTHSPGRPSSAADAVGRGDILGIAVLSAGPQPFQRLASVLRGEEFELFPAGDPLQPNPLSLPAGTGAVLACFAMPDQDSLAAVHRLAGGLGLPLIVLADSLPAETELLLLRQGAEEALAMGPSTDAETTVLRERLGHAIRRAIQRHRSRHTGQSSKDRGAETRAIVDLLPVGLVMCDWDGHVRLSNSRAQALLEQRDALFIDPVGRFRLIDKSGNALLDETMRQVRRGADSDCALSAPRVSGLAPLSILVVPVGHAENGHAKGAALFIAAPEAPLDITPETLEGLYGLTLAEARLVIALVGGQKLEDAAARTGTSPHTLRNQLKSIFRKTDTNRQSELVKLVLTGPAVFRRAPGASVRSPQDGRTGAPPSLRAK